MPLDCPHCRLPGDHARCIGCGRTLIRNLADSLSLKKAMMNVAVGTMTPPPTQRLPGFEYVPHAPSADDTDDVYAARNDTEIPITPSYVADTALPSVPGFELDGVLGRGGMGTVFLARQLSLDRPVALKVMSRKWANDPTFVARFTREAYAAARLSHPNLVQVYDIGETDGQRYFSMEYIEGRSLADVVRAAGKLDPETAVGYILQAARGLKHAHDRGMIHRDVKPDNLLLDGQGLVKVADLGLVKTPDLAREADRLSDSGLQSIPGDMTGARMALGTPAYMSPEQCRDAAAVDHRADIYSLGCTLYALVTGRQPFDGDTAVELMTKHAYTPLVPPEEIAARVPRELSLVIQRMMAKQPGDRYPGMAEVVRVLEQWLGVAHTGHRHTAGEEQIAALERCVDQFNLAPAATFRAKLLTGLFSACVFAAVVLTFVGRLNWAFGLAGLIIQASTFYFVLNGAARGTYLYRRMRQIAVGLSVGDWLVAAAMLALFLILLWMLKLFWMWVGFGMIGAALAFAFRFGLDRTVESERRAAIAGCERLLRRLRVQGMDEAQLRFFVAKYAGRHWEEFFETLFGYEAKLDARATLLRGECAGERERHAGWREPFIAVLDRVERARRAAVERLMLIRVEEERLAADGVPPRQARRLAEAAADHLLHHAAAIRSAENNRVALSSMNHRRMGGTSKEVPNLQKLLAETPLPQVRHDWLPLASAILRGTLAILCLLAFGAWVVSSRGLADLPPEMMTWIDTPNVGLAGILLLTSLFYTGQRMGLLVLLGSVVAVVAHRFGIPAVEPISDHHVGLMLGTVIALVGYRLGRR